MKDENLTVCPCCGRAMALGDEICPYCGKAMKQKKKHKFAKKLIPMAILAVAGFFIFRSMPPVMNPGVDWARIEEVRALAAPPDLELRSMEVSLTERNMLDSEAFWKDEARMAAEFKNASEEEAAAVKYLTNGLSTAGYSREKCLYYLDMNKIPLELAEEIIDRCRVDFKVQATKCALEKFRNYDLGPVSLAEKLLDEGFTQEEVDYAVENCGADWDFQAEQKLKGLLVYGNVSKISATDIMLNHGFSQENVDRAMERVQPDWNLEALQEALESYEFLMDVNRGEVTWEDLDHTLQLSDFTPRQRRYAIGTVMGKDVGGPPAGTLQQGKKAQL